MNVQRVPRKRNDEPDEDLARRDHARRVYEQQLAALAAERVSVQQKYDGKRKKLDPSDARQALDIADLDTRHAARLAAIDAALRNVKRTGPDYSRPEAVSA